ncbi:hypothetical protein A4G18_06475 [Pasteurellaceae bacterium Pebbles2]|nr:hypothetical protein [Pasteurellaceae bacterium Pebbles2]
MMILTKGKHNFWSQLLVSMIAIFALPDAPAADRADFPREYQNQSVQMQTLRAIYQVQQQHQPRLQAQHFPATSTKITKFQPHFVAEVFAAYAPIRGSPVFA